MNGETILFAGGHYELKGNEVSKYYFAGGSRIAVRKYVIPQFPTLTYLTGDHLGSSSLAVDAFTGDVIQTRYKAWGEVRYTTPNKTLPTRFTFTGQYSHVSDEATDLGAAGFGLMFYNARWFDHYLNRFIQADSIVPGGVQGLDRYAYTNNAPINYVDPTGHCTGDPDDRHNPDYACWHKIDQIEQRYSFITVEPENWKLLELSYVFIGLLAMEHSFGGVARLGYSMGNVKLVRDPAEYLEGPFGEHYVGTTSRDGGTITFYGEAFKDETGSETSAVSRGNAVWTTIHEFGHVFAIKNGLYKGYAEEFWTGCVWIGGTCIIGTASPGTTRPYAEGNPHEDFAETFTYTVWLENFSVNVIPNSCGYGSGYLSVPQPISSWSVAPARIFYMQDLIHTTVEDWG